MPEIEIVVTAAGAWLLVGFAIVLGGVFGSFMNVVVYRLPRGLSLSRPGSHCPECKRAIRWRDNVPVLGWLLLGGRCRDCGVQISARYPLVEALVAIVAGWLTWKATAPWTPDGPDDLDATHFVDVAWIVSRLLLVCTLLCDALIEFDGHVPPRRLTRVPLVLGLILALLWPELLPVGDLLPTDGVIASLAGMATAVVIGAGPWLSWLMTARHNRLAYANAGLAALILVGAFLGDHAVIVIGLESMVLAVAARLAARRWPVAGRIAWAGPLVFATLAWVLAWPNHVPFDPQLADDSAIRLVFAAAIMAALAIAVQFTALETTPTSGPDGRT